MPASSTKTVLLTLGRLPVALDIARSFSALGWRVLVAEPFSLHLLRMSRAVSRCFRVTSPVQDREQYLAELRRIIMANEVDLVVPVSEESLHVAALRECGLPNVEIFCTPQQHMLELHDKYRFARLAQSYGLRVPQSLLASSAERSQLTERSAFVMKPRYSCSGRNVSYHPAGDSIAARDDMLVQKKLAGAHYSSFAISRDGKVLAFAAYRATVTDGSVAVAFERVSHVPAVGDWTSTFVERNGHTGFIAFDFIADDDGQIAAIECNPRATSGIHFLTSTAVAQSILGQRAAVPQHRREMLLTESYSCFTVTLGSLFSGKNFTNKLQALRKATDVTWSAVDPWPFLLMMINSYRIVLLALVTRSSFAAAAVRDIEWRDPGNE